MLYISELCEDCTVATEIDYEIDYAWTSIHGNGHVVTACDVWLQQRIKKRVNIYEHFGITMDHQKFLQTLRSHIHIVGGVINSRISKMLNVQESQKNTRLR